MSIFIKKGFTLIELLVVIAVLGVLITVVIIAINPPEQIKKSKDGGRFSTLSQLGHALEAYNVFKGAYPPPSTTWITTLQTAGEINAIPPNVDTGAYSCTYPQNGYCYNFNSGGAIIFLRLEAKSNIAKCSGTKAWGVYSSADGRSGIVCQNSNPSTGTQIFVN